MAVSSGIWILVVGASPLISLPPKVMEVLGAIASTWSAVDVADPATLLEHLSALPDHKVEKIVGPAFIGYGSSETLDLRDAARARSLAGPDQSAVSDLRAACPREEWEHGGSEPDGAVPLFGAHDASGSLSALAGYKTWNGTIAHISIVTHPQLRGRGFGSAAVALAAQHALATGLVPQYRTLRANAPSMRVAARLGFIEYGFSVYVRLRAA
jgi:GNAT superfamily N-acetyltransferase